MVIRDPNVERILDHVGCVAAARLGVAMRDVTHKHPDDVCPPGTVARRMRIAILVGELMMDAMRGHPEDGTAFQSHSPADGQEVFDPLGYFIRSMSEQAMVAHTDSEAH